MGRTATKPKPAVELPELDSAAINQNIATMTEHSAEVMAQFGDGLPYDRIRVVNEARFYMAQSAEAMLEAGKRLIVLKEHEPHGDFTQIVTEQLGLADRTARLMMQAAFKYLSPALESKRQALAVWGRRSSSSCWQKMMKTWLRWLTEERSPALIWTTSIE